VRCCSFTIYLVVRRRRGGRASLFWRLMEGGPRTWPMEVLAEQAARGRPWPWPERRVSIAARRPLDLRPMLGGEAEWSRVALGMLAGAPSLPLPPIGGGPRARVDAASLPPPSPPFPHLQLRPLSHLRSRHRPSSTASPRRLRWPPSSPRAVGMARERVGPPPRPHVQARPGRMGRRWIWRRRSRTQPSRPVWRPPMQPKNGKSDLEVALPALSRPSTDSLMYLCTSPPLVNSRWKCVFGRGITVFPTNKKEREGAQVPAAMAAE
jgi:hypothetical protein